jgi:energy-coupling factor transporter transmembrane protein EcfT
MFYWRSSYALRLSLEKYMHAFTKILIYLMVMILINFVEKQIFWVVCISLCLIACLLQKTQFLNRCHKMRWLFLSIILIYAFGTPGEYITNNSNAFIPTKEGIVLGLEQVATILMAIAFLSILFYQATLVQLMGGLHRLLIPFTWIGFNVDRFVVRLLLTLNYVDELTKSKQNTVNVFKLHELLPSELAATQVVDVEKLPLTLLDFITILLMLFILLLVIILKFFA